MSVALQRTAIELRYLRHFVGVVECGSFSRATNVLHITQPALTRSIHVLERQLGAQLLDRQPRGVVPTEAGELFLRHAKLILSELEAAREEVVALDSGAHGSVHVGIAALFANTIIDDAVAQLLRQNPGITVSITVGLFDELAEMLRDGRIDCIFSVMPPAASARGICFEPLWNIASVIVASARHPLAQQANVTKEDLQNTQWALVDQRQTQAFVESFFAADGFTAPAAAVRTNSLGVIRALLRKGDFVSFLAAHWIEPEVSRGEFKILNVPATPVRRKAGLLYREVPYRRAAVGLLMDQIRTVCRSLEPDGATQN